MIHTQSCLKIAGSHCFDLQPSRIEDDGAAVKGSKSLPFLFAWLPESSTHPVLHSPLSLHPEMSKKGSSRVTHSCVAPLGSSNRASSRREIGSWLVPRAVDRGGLEGEHSKEMMQCEFGSGCVCLLPSVDEIPPSWSVLHSNRGGQICSESTINIRRDNCVPRRIPVAAKRCLTAPNVWNVVVARRSLRSTAGEGRQFLYLRENRHEFECNLESTSSSR
jgi:hypothetical protein